MAGAREKHFIWLMAKSNQRRRRGRGSEIEKVGLECSWNVYFIFWRLRRGRREMDSEKGKKRKLALFFGVSVSV
jgi:hypothetical protein